MAIQKPYRTDYGSRSVSPLGYAKRELSFHHHTKLAGCRTPFILARTGRPRVCQTPPLAIHKRKLADRPIAIGVCLKKKDALYMETEKEIKEHFISYQQTEQTIPYRKTLPHIRFVDTIGLVCPFLHQCDFSDLAIRQIEEYDHCLWEEVFPPHAYDLASHKPLGVFDWARGWGWYVLGLIETADLPGNKKRILNLSNHLLPFQKADGGFSCLVFNPNERFESSGSALFGLLFVHAYRVSGDERYLNAAIKIEKHL